jgi:RNA polymerase sigma-70 factor (ECF subfamily)
MRANREALAAWVGREILPHEQDLRIWLGRRFVEAFEVEDIVQECYCRLSQLRDVSEISEPRAYLFTIARRLAVQQRRQASVVRLETLDGEIERYAWDDTPGPDRIAAARQELNRMRAAVATLSDRARRIFVMRKVEGLSQKEIAAALGVSETVVENDASRSLRAVLKLMTAPTIEPAPAMREGRHARSH